MTLDTLIMLGGAFVAALPFLGFPSSVDTILLFIAGIFIIGLGIALRRRTVAKAKEERHKESFMQQSSSATPDFPHDKI